MGENLFAWSTTALTNGTVDASINFAEGQLPSTVNNSNRSVMAAIARYVQDTNGSLSTTGSANAYLLTVNGTYTALATGLRVRFKANFSNTNAATLAVTGGSALTAKALRVIGSGGDRALVAGDIIANGHYDCEYDAAANGAAGAWIVTNPTALGPAGAWATYTPTISAASGSFSSVTAAGRYSQQGKSVIGNVNVAVGASGKGTAATYFLVPLPVAPLAGAGVTIAGWGAESAVNGKALSVLTNFSVASGASLIVRNYDATDPIANSALYDVRFSYEAA